MKKRTALIILYVLLLTSCGKGEISARYFPRVSEDADTRATWDDIEHSVEWENGDMLNLQIDVGLQVPKEHFDGIWPYKYGSVQRINVRLVFNNGKWSTYRLIDGTWSEVDCIVVSAPSTDYEVRLRNTYDNKDQVGEDSSERFMVSTWWTIPFIQGDQILDIRIPFEDYKWPN